MSSSSGRRHRVTPLLAAAAVGAFAAAARAETRNVIVDDPRPVAAALEELAIRHGRVVTYEDPRYLYAGDIKDVTREVRRDLDRFPPGQAPKVLIPLGGRLDFSYAVSPATGEPEDWDALLQTLLETHAANGGGGRFRVERSDDVYHVIPAVLRNSDGRLVNTASILDAYITVPEQSLTHYEMVSAICTAVSEAMDVNLVNGTRIGTGIQPVGGTPREPFVVKNEKARDVLLRTLQRVGRPSTWRILQQPGTTTYVLNVSRVVIAAERAAPAEPPRLSPPPCGSPTPAGGFIRCPD